jgi:hypothetical protein
MQNTSILKLFLFLKYHAVIILFYVRVVGLVLSTAAHSTIEKPTHQQNIHETHNTDINKIITA